MVDDCALKVGTSGVIDLDRAANRDVAGRVDEQAVPDIEPQPRCCCLTSGDSELKVTRFSDDERAVFEEVVAAREGQRLRASGDAGVDLLLELLHRPRCNS